MNMAFWTLSQGTCIQRKTKIDIPETAWARFRHVTTKTTQLHAAQNIVANVHHKSHQSHPQK